MVRSQPESPANNPRIMGGGLGEEPSKRLIELAIGDEPVFRGWIDVVGALGIARLFLSRPFF